MSIRRRLSAGIALTLALVVFQSAHAQTGKADADRYFPDGTDVIVQINLNQLMGSQLLQKAIPLVVKKYGEDIMNKAAEHVPDDNVKSMIQQMAPNLKEQVTEEAVSMGMMMAKEAVQDFVVAMNTKEEKDGTPQILMILRSPKIEAEALAQFLPLMESSGQVKVKTDKVGDTEVFEMDVKGQPQSFFLAIPENGVMVMSPFKNIIESSLKNKKGAKLDAKMKDVWAQRKSSYSLFVAGIAPKKREEEIKSFTINLTLDKDFKGSANVICKDAATAKEHGEKANEFFSDNISFVTNFAEKHAELKPIADALKNVKAEVKDDQVNLKVMLKGDDLLKAIKSAK
jgi:hypothetical protein